MRTRIAGTSARTRRCASPGRLKAKSCCPELVVSASPLLRDCARRKPHQATFGPTQFWSGSGAGFCFIDGMPSSNVSLRFALLAVGAVALSLPYDGYNTEAQTGGYSHYDFANDAENSEVRNND